MAQRVLIVKTGGGDVISRPWNFEAACLCDDHREEKGAAMGIHAVSYLFEGTAVTDEVLQQMEEEQLNLLCRKVQAWYLIDIFKNAPGGAATHEGDSSARLRDLYKKVFQTFGILPKDLALCAPKDLFFILQGDEVKEADIPQPMRQLYGY